MTTLSPPTGTGDPRPPGLGTPPAAPARRARRRLRRRLVAPALVAVVVQATVAVGDVLPAVDTLVYLESGRNLVEGNGFTRFGGPELHFPPLVPAVLGALLEVTGSEIWAVRTWSLVSGLALAAAVTALARRLWDDDTVTVTAAWVAGTLCGLGPMLVRRGSGSEGITAALLLAAVVVVLGPSASSGAPRRGLGALAGGGLLAGLAYLARPEALLPALLLGAALLGDAWRRRRPGVDPSAALAFGLGLALVVGPYVTYLHGHTGSWSPTSKSRDVSIEAWRAVAEDDRDTRDQILYAVDETGADFVNDTTSLTGLAAEDPRAWLGIVGVNARTLTDLYLLPGTDERASLVPLPLVVAAVVGAWRARRRPAARVALAVAALPVATCTAFFVLPRYLVLTTAVVAAFAAAGVVAVVRALPGRARPLLVAALAGWMAFALVVEAGPLLPGGTPIETDQQVVVARWVEENSAPDDRVMTRSFHVQYYSRRPVVALPAAGYAETLAFARARGVRFLVADARTIRARRARLYDDLVLDPDPEGLREVARFGRGRDLVRVFELTPRPPATDLPPLPLGFVGD